MDHGYDDWINDATQPDRPNLEPTQSSEILLWLGLDWPSVANIWCLVRFSSLCAILCKPKKGAFSDSGAQNL